MAVKKHSRGLGAGLNELIPPKNDILSQSKQDSENPIELPLNKVEPDRDQPRKNFNEDSLLELSESIKKHGVFQPLLVQKKDDYYKIIAGERRWRAAKIAGLKTVPVIIKDLSEQEIAEIQLIENIQREDLNPIEVAEGYRQLIDKFHMTQDELAEKVSKSRTAITNSLRLLKLDERVRQMVIEDMITTGHARALLAIDDKNKQYEFAQMVFDKKMTVREVEKAIRNISKEKKEKKKKIDRQSEIIYKDLENKIRNNLGTKVNIMPKDTEKGKIEIEYYSSDELNRIVELLKNSK